MKEILILIIIMLGTPIAIILFITCFEFILKKIKTVKILVKNKNKNDN